MLFGECHRTGTFHHWYTSQCGFIKAAIYRNWRNVLCCTGADPSHRVRAKPKGDQRFRFFKELRNGKINTRVNRVESSRNSPVEEVVHHCSEECRQSERHHKKHSLGPRTSRSIVHGDTLRTRCEQSKNRSSTQPTFLPPHNLCGDSQWHSTFPIQGGVK